MYELIVRRFLSIFYPPAVYYKVTLNEKAKDELFVRTVKVLQDPEQSDRRNGNPMQLFDCTAQTSPPARYTSGSMVLAMEKCRKSHRGRRIKGADQIERYRNIFNQSRNDQKSWYVLGICC